MVQGRQWTCFFLSYAYLRQSMTIEVDSQAHYLCREKKRIAGTTYKYMQHTTTTTL